MLEIKALGPMMVLVDGALVDKNSWHRHSTKQVLQLLLSKRKYRISKIEAIDLLWPELNTNSATNKLYIAVNGLRNLLEPERALRGKSKYIATHSGYIELLMEENGIEFDVVQFENLIAQSENHPNKFEVLEKAVSMYEGELFSGSPPEVFWLHKRKELQQKYSRAVIQLAQQRFDQHEFESAERLLLNLLAIESTHEEGCRWLMRVCAAKGARFVALQHYEILSKNLAENLGIKPDTITEALVQEIRKGEIFTSAPALAEHSDIKILQDASGITNQLTPSDVRLDSPTKLGRQYRIPSNFLRPIIGREEISAKLQQMVQQRAAKNLCLHGLHGIGKSALAAQVAHQTQSHFSQGAVRVDFSGITEPDCIMNKLQEALELPQAQALKNFLACADLLVLLEQVASVSMAEALLKFFEPYEKTLLLITTRSAVHAKDVYCKNILVTALPSTLDNTETTCTGSMSPSISLFIEKLKSYNPELNLGSQQMKAIASMVMELDGIPRAIEMAANLALLMPIDEVTKQINIETYDTPSLSKHDIDGLPEDKFSQLTETNCETLSEKAQHGLMILSIFRSRFSFKAACCLFNSKEELLFILSELVDADLLINNVSNEKTPYHLTRLTRRFAYKKLLTNPVTYSETKRRYALHILQTVEDSVQDMDEGIADAAFLTLEHLYDDVLDVIDWCLEFDANISMRLCVGLTEFWLCRSALAQAIEYCTKVLNVCDADRTGIDKSIYRQLHFSLGKLHTQNYDPIRSNQHFICSLSLNVDKPNAELDIALQSELLHSFLESGNYEEAFSYVQPLMQHIEQKNDKTAALAWLNLGEYHFANGNLEEADVCVENGLEIARWHAPIHIFIQALLKKSALLALLNNRNEAQYALKECQQLAVSYSNLNLRPNISLQQAEISLSLGLVEEAEKHFSATRQYSFDYANKKCLALSFIGLAKCAALQKQYDLAIPLLDQARGLIGVDMNSAVKLEAERLGLLLYTLGERHTKTEHCLKEIKRSWKYVAPIARQHLIDSILVVGAAHGISPIISMLSRSASPGHNYFLHSQAERQLFNLVNGVASEEIFSRKKGASNKVATNQWHKNFTTLLEHLQFQSTLKLYG